MKVVWSSISLLVNLNVEEDHKYRDNRHRDGDVKDRYIMVPVHTYTASLRMGIFQVHKVNQLELQIY